MRTKLVFAVLAWMLTCGFALSSVNAQNSKYIDKIIAKVGGEYLLLSDLEAQYALMESERGTLPENVRCAILNDLLTKNLLLNQAKLDSVVVTEQEVDNQLSARIERILQLMNNDVEQFQNYYGKSVNEVRLQMREDLVDQMIIERMQKQLIGSARITPSEVKQFFDQIPTDSLPYFSSEVELGEIIIFPEVSEAEEVKAHELAMDLRTRVLEGGEDFGELAKKYSQDPGSGRIGGDLGWANRGDYVPEFEAVAYGLSPGEYSEVFRSEYGYHFLQLIERRGNRIHVRHILIKPVITEQDMELTYRKLDSIRQLIEVDSLSFSQAVKKFSDEDVQSYNNDGRMINPQTGNTFYETAQLEPNVYFTIEEMEVGSVSEPFEYADRLGNRAYRIIQLQTRTQPHTASLVTDYTKIRQAALEQKRNKLIGEWVERNLKNTYVELDGSYRDCSLLEAWYTHKP